MTVTRSEDQALELIQRLSSEIGPRRPCSSAEREAADLVRGWLVDAGVEAKLQEFRGYSSFAWPFGAILALGLMAGLMPKSWRRRRAAAAAAAAGGLVVEGDLRWAAISRIISRLPSQNVVATIEPSGRAQRTLVVSCHLDSSRSGLMFEPAFVGHLRTWTVAQSVAVLFAGFEGMLARWAWSRRMLTLARAVMGLGLVGLAEREIRGVDVPGASDNASGVGVVAALGAELAVAPLSSTRVILLFSGCEEAGTLGAQAFMRSGVVDSDALYLNFDNVGGPGTVRYLTREGIIARWDADPGLVRAADSVAASQPALGFTSESDPAGLTYDSSPVLARGGRAMTISVQDGSIPNLHLPTDVFENLDPDAVARTLGVGSAMLAAIDRGEADPA